MSMTVLEQESGLRVTCAACGDVVPARLATHFVFNGHSAPYCHECSLEHARDELVAMSRDLAEAS